MKKRIIITGGHLTPALGIIEILKNKNFEIFYIGRQYSQEGIKIPSQESIIIPKVGVNFIPIVTGRLQRKFTIYTIPSLLKIPIGFFQAIFLVWRIKPSLILSFGSYVSVPVVFAGWLLGVPVITHEQTVYCGLANKINSFFSTKIAISFRESLPLFPFKKTVVTGNIIRKGILLPKKTDFSEQIESLVCKYKQPLIFITGGNQGSLIINQAVIDSLKALLKKYIIVHQTGSFDYPNVLKKYGELPIDCRQKYFVKDFLTTEEIGWVLNNANLIISRAGANITYEIGVLGKPAIFIPLPFAGGQEQLKNAMVLKKIGLAEVIIQKELSSKKLIFQIEKIFKNYQDYLSAGRDAKKIFIKNGAKNLTNLIFSLFTNEQKKH